jgi:DNA-binding XRE family transcriptional regulator
MENNYWKAKHSDEENFIRNVIYMRELMEMSQSDMSKRVGYGLKFKTYQSWEERRAFPPIFFCRRISEVFSIELEVMLTQRLVGKTA